MSVSSATRTARIVSAETFQALNDLGFSIPAGGVAYWVGEAMGSVDFKELKLTPAKVSDAIETTARNAAHLAKILKAEEYPGKN